MLRPTRPKRSRRGSLISRPSGGPPAPAPPVAAYGRDITQFMAFLADHLGGAPTLDDLSGLTPSDFRAFLARRRNEGSGSRTLARQLSAIRTYFRFLERRIQYGT